MDEIKALKEALIYNKPHAIRGRIINHTIYLERIIDECIASYFFADFKRKIELIEVLISSDTLTYNGKVNLLIRLLKKIYTPEVFNKRFVGMAKELQQIASDRNKFAHLMSHPNMKDEEEKKYAICLVDTKEVNKPITFTDEDVLNIILRIHKYVLLIPEIKQEIIGMGNPS